MLELAPELAGLGQEYWCYSTDLVYMYETVKYLEQKLPRQVTRIFLAYKFHKGSKSEKKA